MGKETVSEKRKSVSCQPSPFQSSPHRVAVVSAGEGGNYYPEMGCSGQGHHGPQLCLWLLEMNTWPGKKATALPGS